MKLLPKLPFLLLIVAIANVWPQQQGERQQGAQQRVAELKESIAANKAKLQKYQWIEMVQVSVTRGKQED
jgi:Flp pilus assembly protein TadB